MRATILPESDGLACKVSSNVLTSLKVRKCKTMEVIVANWHATKEDDDDMKGTMSLLSDG